MATQDAPPTDVGGAGILGGDPGSGDALSSWRRPREGRRSQSIGEACRRGGIAARIRQGEPRSAAAFLLRDGVIRIVLPVRACVGAGGTVRRGSGILPRSPNPQGGTGVASMAPSETPSPSGASPVLSRSSIRSSPLGPVILVSKSPPAGQSVPAIRPGGIGKRKSDPDRSFFDDGAKSSFPRLAGSRHSAAARRGGGGDRPACLGWTRQVSGVIRRVGLKVDD